MLKAWNGPWWGYLHHRNWQAWKIGWGGGGVVVSSGDWFVIHLLAYHWLAAEPPVPHPDPENGLCSWTLPQPPPYTHTVNRWLLSVYLISGTPVTSYHCAEQVRTKMKLTFCLYTSMEACICLKEGILISKSLNMTHRAIGSIGLGLQSCVCQVGHFFQFFWKDIWANSAIF